MTEIEAIVEEFLKSTGWHIIGRWDRISYRKLKSGMLHHIEITKPEYPVRMTVSVDDNLQVFAPWDVSFNLMEPDSFEKLGKHLHERAKMK